MLKQEFLETLKNKLSGLPKEDLNERLDFYKEMIDDQMEEGLSEEEAVKNIGTPQEVATQIIKDTPFSKIAKERLKPKRRLSGIEITFLIAGFPIWFSLLASVFAILISVYASIWAGIISLWAGFASLVGCFVGGLISGSFLAIFGNASSGILLIGASILCAGLAIFFFFACKELTKLMLILTKKLLFWCKTLLLKKEVE